MSEIKSSEWIQITGQIKQQLHSNDVNMNIKWINVSIYFSLCRGQSIRSLNSVNEKNKVYSITVSFYSKLNEFSLLNGN